MTVSVTPVSLSKNLASVSDDRAAGELEGQRSDAAGVNDTPGACQSRSVTEPQRDQARLEFNQPPSEKG